MASSNILQSPTWSVGKVSPRCAACQSALAPGDACWAALVEWPRENLAKNTLSNSQDSPASRPAAGWQRLDFCPSCWSTGRRPAAPTQMFSWWKTVVPDPGRRRKTFVDDSVLLELFNRLAERRDLENIRFRFVLALLLMRKRLLKYEASQAPGPEWHDLFAGATPQPELWKMTRRADQTAVTVINPHLTTDQIGAVSAQLSGILAEEI